MEKELKLKTQWPSIVTDISFGTDIVFSKLIPELLSQTKNRCVILTDSNLEKIIAPKLSHYDLKIFSFPAGEHSKTRETKILLEDYLLSHNYGRDTTLLALGGGVVCDLAGFLASTYCRGISLIQVPTSLIAMVDACVGGKTGVNTSYGKNMIGSFYPAEEVWIDGAFLSSLSQRQRTNGVVEIIKTALIDSPPLFYSLYENPEKWKAFDLPFIMETIFACLVIKKTIVMEDPEEEKGLRRKLNLGHTFGHAIETLENFALEHGEAVAIGLMVSSYISWKMGHLSEEDFQLIEEILKRYDVPLKLPNVVDVEDMMSTLVRDKKSVDGRPRLVLLKTIGEVLPFDGQYCSFVDFHLLEEAIQWMNQKFGP